MEAEIQDSVPVDVNAGFVVYGAQYVAVTIKGKFTLLDIGDLIDMLQLTIRQLERRKATAARTTRPE